MAKRYFHWDTVNDCVLSETDESGDTVVTYTREPGPNGRLISEERNGTTYTHHDDGLGNTQFLTDDTGDITDTFTYDAWGDEVTRTGTTPTPYRWGSRWGYQHDMLTGGYYGRERSYQPTLARWMNIDPMELQEYYRYARCSPVHLFVPSALAVRGLTVVVTTVGVSIKRQCGKGAEVQFEFALSGEAPCAGFLVQKIDYFCDIEACKGKKCSAKLPRRPTATYYEAWPVNIGAKRWDVTKFYKDKVEQDNFTKHTDSSTASFLDDKCGETKAEGEVRFYCSETVEDEMKTWKKEASYGDGDCEITSGRAPSSKDAKFWKKKPDGAAGKREFTASWKCCPCAEEIHKITYDPLTRT